MLHFTMGKCNYLSRNIVWQKDSFINIYNAQLVTVELRFKPDFIQNCE